MDALTATDRIEGHATPAAEAAYLLAHAPTSTEHAAVSTLAAPISQWESEPESTGPPEDTECPE